MNKAREISNFLEYQTIFCDQYTLKKADPETFSFLVNNTLQRRNPCFIIVHKCNFLKVVIKVIR